MNVRGVEAANDKLQHSTHPSHLCLSSNELIFKPECVGKFVRENGELPDENSLQCLNGLLEHSGARPVDHGECGCEEERGEGRGGGEGGSKGQGVW